MTIVHRRSMTLLPGRLGAYVEIWRELAAYHKANGCEYEFQLAFGNDSSRVAIAARYESVAAVEKYYRKVMADPVFQQLAGKTSAHLVAGSVTDDFWRFAITPSKPGSGPVFFVRTMGILPGQQAATMAIMKEFVDYFESIGVGVVCAVPAGMGDPLRCALAARCPDVARLEAVTEQAMADPRWREISLRNARNLVPGSMRDAIWLAM